MRVKSLVVARITDFVAAADNRFPQVNERLRVRAASPAQITLGRRGEGNAPKPSRSSSNGSKRSRSGRRRLAGVQVAISNIAQKRERQVERQAPRPAAARKIGGEGVLQRGRGRARAVRGLAIAKKVRVVSPMVVTDGGGRHPSRLLS